MRYPLGFPPVSASSTPAGNFHPFTLPHNSSVFALPQISAPNLSNLVTITLSSPEDYLLWKTQITCLLLSHQLLGMVDGSAIIPPTTVLDESSGYVPKVHFYEYLRIYQQIKSGIHATLSRDVFC